MSPTLPSVLVIGCGSIGERHVRTFLATDRVRVLACDNRAELRQQMAEKYRVETLENWTDALGRPEVIAAVIATPAPLHVALATRFLASGRHVLCEKPLALDLTGVDDLISTRDKSGYFAGVAYVLHFLPALRAARDFLQGGSFGPVRHVAITTGQHFPFFRPAYREIYYRDRAQGGGAIQDALTHMANAVEWILGPTSRVYCDSAHQVLAGVTVEDTVNVTARNGVALVSYALNQFQSPNETRLDFHADTGSLRVEVNQQRWGTLARGEADWTWHPAPVPERDTMFIAQAQAFLDGCGGRTNVLCTLEGGRQTLRFNMACLESCAKNVPVDL